MLVNEDLNWYYLIRGLRKIETIIPIWANNSKKLIQFKKLTRKEAEALKIFLPMGDFNKSKSLVYTVTIEDINKIKEIREYFFLQSILKNMKTPLNNIGALTYTLNLIERDLKKEMAFFFSVEKLIDLIKNKYKQYGYNHINIDLFNSNNRI